MKSEKWHLYSIRNIWSGRIYLGLTQSPQGRLSRHMTKSSNAELTRDIEAMGSFSFQFRVVETFDSRDEASFGEMRAINFMQEIGGLYAVYNRVQGGLDHGPKIPKYIRDSLFNGKSVPSEKHAARISDVAARRAGSRYANQQLREKEDAKRVKQRNHWERIEKQCARRAKSEEKAVAAFDANILLRKDVALAVRKLNETRPALEEIRPGIVRRNHRGEKL